MEDHCGNFDTVQVPKDFQNEMASKIPCVILTTKLSTVPFTV